MSPSKPMWTHTLPATADLVVVGGGVIGAATAFFAARAGLAVVVIERRPLLGTLATSAATGAFRLQFDNPHELALVRESVAFFDRFADETGLRDVDLGIHHQGYLWVATEPATAERQRDLVRQQRAWGLDDVHLLDARELRSRHPWLADHVLQARWRAGDGWLDARALANGLARASAAPLVTETRVTGFVRRGDRVVGVETTRGTVSCARVVIAAGCFAAELAAWAGCSLPIAPTRRQRLLLPDVPEVPRHAPMTIDEETGAHWRPWLAGANCMWTEPGTPSGPPLEDVPPSDDFAFALLDPASPQAVARIAPFWRAVWDRGGASWVSRAGQYDYTPDHRPLIGALPADGLFVNAGYSGHGIMASAGGSRLLVDVMLGRVGAAANPFRPDRKFEARSSEIL